MSAEACAICGTCLGSMGGQRGVSLSACIEAHDLAGTMEVLRKDIEGYSEEN